MLRLLAVLFGLMLATPVMTQEQNGGLQFFFAKAEELVTPYDTRDWTVAEHKELMEAHGINGATFFYKLTSADNLRLPYEVPMRLYLDRGYPLIITLLIDDGDSQSGKSEGTDATVLDPGLLERLVGKPENSDEQNRELNQIRFPESSSVEQPRYFDDELRRLADKVAKDGREVYFQIFHEGNGAGWYPWNIGARGNSCGLLAQAWEHVHDIFLDAGATNAKFVNNLNRRGVDGVLENAACYFTPIDELELVVAHSVSSYNRCGTSPSYPEERSFADDFAPMYERLVELTNKPIWVAETSTSGECAPRIPWFEEMLSDVNTRFPRVERITFLMGDVQIGAASNVKPITWGLEGDEKQLRQFRELIQSYEEARSAPAEPSQVRPAARPTRVVRSTRPALRPVTTASIETVADTQTVLSFGGERSWNWEVWGDLRTTFGDEPIPGYGSAGTIAQGTLRFNYLDEGTVQSGPSILLGGVLSDNCDERYWQCQVRAEASYIWRWRPAEFGDYNRLQFGLGVGYRYYTDGQPSRLENGDTYGFVVLTWVVGGDFK